MIYMYYDVNSVWELGYFLYLLIVVIIIWFLYIYMIVFYKDEG